MQNRIDKAQATQIALNDFAKRIGAAENEIRTVSIEDATFPDSSLGAGEAGEMSMQVLTEGWRIALAHKNTRAEYRATAKKVRLYQFGGKNYRIFP